MKIYRLLIAVLLLVACQVAPLTSTQTAAPISAPASAPVATVLPTATVRPSPQTILPQDDYGHAMPTATLPSQPTPTLAPVSRAGFQNQFSVADQFVARLIGIPAAPEGQAYQGWLVADGDGSRLDLGVAIPDVAGSLTLEFTSRTGENLLARYARFELTLEPAAGSPAPTGDILYTGVLDADALSLARQLFVKNDGAPATPLNTSFASGLLNQYDLAVQHIVNAQNAAAIGALDEMHTHLEHVINILEGASGARFKDYTGDGAAQNPGDGFGVRSYAAAIAALLGEAAQTPNTTLQTGITALQDECVAIAGLGDATQIKDRLAALKTTADDLAVASLQQLYALTLQRAWFDVAPPR
jgi:hypothetical protein